MKIGSVVSEIVGSGHRAYLLSSVALFGVSLEPLAIAQQVGRQGLAPKVRDRQEQHRNKLDNHDSSKIDNE